MLTIFFPITIMLLLIIKFPMRLLWANSPTILVLLSIFFLTSVSSVEKISCLGTYFDTISITLIILTLWISSAIILASQHVLKRNSPHIFLFYVIMLLLILMLAFCANQAISFYIYFEASLIPTLLIIIGWGYQPERLQAGLYLILYTVTASLPLLLSLMLLMSKISHISFILPHWQFFFTSPLIKAWWGFTILAFLVKTPLFLTHLWLPKAHVEAPVAGSIVLAGILLKLGSYGLIRISRKLVITSQSISIPVIVVSTIGGALARLICIRQTDVKSLIAYSSVSHIGLATGGIISNSIWGWQGALAILIAHGLCSSCLFSLANITYETTQSRRIYVTAGLLNLFPSLTFWWFSFTACNIAAPPSINLAREILLISSNIFFAITNFIPLAIITFMAAAYSLILYTSTQHGPSPKALHPLQLLTPRNYIVCLIHLLPIILLITKFELIRAI